VYQRCLTLLYISPTNHKLSHTSCAWLDTIVLRPICVGESHATQLDAPRAPTRRSLNHAAKLVCVSLLAPVLVVVRSEFFRRHGGPCTRCWLGASVLCAWVIRGALPLRCSLCIRIDRGPHCYYYHRAQKSPCRTYWLTA